MSCDNCAIKNLIYSYAHKLDRGDLQGVAAMFSAGRILAGGSEEHAVQIVGAEAVEQLYSSFTRLYEDDGSPHTMHLTSNCVVEVEASGSAASARSYAVVFQAVDGLPLQPIIGVRYYDKFRKLDGVWRFDVRRIDTRLTGDLSHHLLQDM